MAQALIRVGTVEVVVLCDGCAPLALSGEVPGHQVDWSAERTAYPWAFGAVNDGTWAWHVHAFLLRLAGGAVLVDTGIGHLGRAPYDVTGRIDDELREAGVGPVDVRHVIHTHLHSDHAGGACRPDGQPRFPNAVHHVHPADWDFFAGADDPEDAQGRNAMRRLEELGMLDLDPVDREVVPGVRVVHSPGHTPGHRSVLLADDSATLLLTGDLLHLPIQVAHPEWPSNHDEDPERGVASRIGLLGRARQGRWVVAVSHFGLPFGVVVGEGRSQRWGPARDGAGY
jgi:glyoxylase-like metal-dependent hydrolase (beta-lactamase superfamily II)